MKELRTISHMKAIRVLFLKRSSLAKQHRLGSVENVHGPIWSGPLLQFADYFAFAFAFVICIRAAQSHGLEILQPTWEYMTSVSKKNDEQTARGLQDAIPA